jgi:hypothetical protein
MNAERVPKHMGMATLRSSVGVLEVSQLEHTSQCSLVVCYGSFS